MIASNTTAMPLSKPRPMSRRWMLASTSLPRPPAPTIEAMITIDSAIMMVWLTPAMIDGMALGSWTLNNS